SFSGTSPFWVSDNGTGLATVYGSTGAPLSVVVTVPGPGGSPANFVSSPTGQVANPSASEFFIKGTTKPSSFIFDTEDGTISAWSGSTGAVPEVDNSATAVYKG